VSGTLTRTGSLALALALAPWGAAPAADAGTERAELMRRLSRLAGLYRDAALHFAARETIHYHAHAGRQSWRFDYVYRHDAERGLQDFRLKHQYRERKRVDPADIVDPDDIPVPAMLLRAYSWAFIFETGQRDRFRFELLAPGEALGRPAWRVSFEGLPPLDADNAWVGTVWVDTETSQLLRVEARRTPEHKAWARYRRALEESAAGERDTKTFHSIETVTTEFTEVKNAMRFPGEVSVERRQYGAGDLRTGIRIYLVRQIYGDYRFYNVRTQEEVRSVVADP
jgi:hypothetical protein